MFIDASDSGTYLKVLHWVTQQVANHPHIVGMSQLDEHDDKGTLIGQCRMHRMPDPLMAVNDPGRLGLFERQVERPALVTDPFGTPLPTLARLAPLQQKLLLCETLPERRVEPVPRWHGGG
jgi:hypothetical protein